MKTFEFFKTNCKHSPGGENFPAVLSSTTVFNNSQNLKKYMQSNLPEEIF